MLLLALLKAIVGKRAEVVPKCKINSKLPPVAPAARNFFAYFHSLATNGSIRCIVDVPYC